MASEPVDWNHSLMWTLCNRISQYIPGYNVSTFILFFFLLGPVSPFSFQERKSFLDCQIYQKNICIK